MRKQGFVCSIIAAASVLAMTTGVFADTYTGTAEGFAGEVSVTLEIEDGVLISAKAEGDGETPDVGGRALELLPS